jgi:nicotinamide-nucleotide amidase
MKLKALARQLGEVLQTQELMVTTAESCTAGWVAKVITDIAGSSSWFERGFVTYSNAAKQEMLEVKAETLAYFGAVSKEAVVEMARGALQHSRAGISVAISGVAGPGGGTIEKPIGTVWFAWALKTGEGWTAKEWLPGSREAVRRQAVVRALQGLLDVLKQPG